MESFEDLPNNVIDSDDEKLRIKRRLYLQAYRAKQKSIYLKPADFHIKKVNNCINPSTENKKTNSSSISTKTTTTTTETPLGFDFENNLYGFNHESINDNKFKSYNNYSNSTVNDDQISSEDESTQHDRSDTTSSTFDSYHEGNESGNESENIDNCAECDDDFTNDRTFLFKSSNMKLNEFMLSFCEIVLTHNISDNTANDILKFIKNMCPEQNIVPNSFNLFKKKFIKTNIVKHFRICENCLITVETNDLKANKCEVCKKDYIYFATFDVKYQIECILRRKNYLELIKKPKFNTNEQKIDSVYDGSKYKSLIKNTDSSKILVTLGLNSDGAPLVVDTNVSMWPVLAKIIELPDVIGESFKNLVFVGMWLSNNKPVYDKFLEKCVNQVIEAQNVRSNSTKTIPNLIVKCLYFVADLPARAAFLNIKQFNGFFGCLTCFHPGEYLNEYKKMIYRPTRNLPILDDNTYRILSINADKFKTEFFGVKGTCALSRIINIPSQIPYDYMHLVLQGHCKWLLKQIFLKKKSPATIYNDNNKDIDINSEFQSILSDILVPHTFTRKPKNVNNLSKWKSSEVKLFMFYFAIPLLINYLPSIYYCMIASYILAIRLLYEPIEKSELINVKRAIENYVESLGTYFGLYAYDFTIHGHLHLADQVESFGPLKGHSQFVFEGALGNLKKKLHGSRGFLNQITQKINLMVEFYNEVDTSFVQLKDQMRGSLRKREFSVIEKDLCKQYLGLSVNCDVFTSDKAKIGDKTIHSKKYLRKGKTNSYTVSFAVQNSKEYGEIVEFFQLEGTIYAFIDVYDINQDDSFFPEKNGTGFYDFFTENFQIFYVLVKDLGNKPKRFIVKASKILNKCIKIRVGHLNFLTELKFEIEHD